MPADSERVALIRIIRTIEFLCASSHSLAAQPSHIPILSQVLGRDAYKCTITGSTLGSDSTCGSGPTAPGALLDVVPIIPPSVDIRTLSRYAGLSSGDPLSEPTPRFFRLENLLTLDDDASDAFRSLNVWLEETVRLRVIPCLILTISHPHPSPPKFSTLSFPTIFSLPSLSLLGASLRCALD